MKGLKKETIYMILIAIIIIFNERFFYLLDSTSKIQWIIIYSLTFLLYVIFINEIGKYKFEFSKIIFIMIFLTIVNFFRTYYVFGQPINLSLSTYRYTLILLLYFPLCILLKKINIHKLKLVIVTISSIASIIYYFQKLIYPKFIYLNVFFSERFGEVRFFNGVSLITLGFFITLSLIFEKNSLKDKVILSVFLISQLNFIIFVAQSRNIILPLIFILLIVLLKEALTLNLRKLFFISISIISLSIAVFPYFKEMTDSILNDIGRDAGSAYIRILSQEYFINKIKENLFLGYGLFSDSYIYGSFLKGTFFKYYAEDIGLIGLTFQFGLVYSLIYVWVFIKIIIDAFRQKINRGDKQLLVCFSVFTLLYSPFSVLLNVDNSIFIFVLFITIYEVIIYEKRTEIYVNDRK